MKEIPVIEQALLVTYQRHCNGCGGSTPEGIPTEADDLQFFNLRTGSATVFTIAWCKDCREKVANALASMDKEQAE